MKRSSAIVLAAASAVALVTGPVAAEGATSTESPVQDGIIVAGPGPNTVQFPDGTYVKFPSGTVKVTRTAAGMTTTLRDGTTFATPEPDMLQITHTAVYPPVAIWYSRTAVEEMWKAKNNINNVCRIVPLPYFASLGCGAPGNLADALDRAHYQKKRIKALYYQCKGATYCSYYTYTVAP